MTIAAFAERLNRIRNIDILELKNIEELDQVVKNTAEQCASQVDKAALRQAVEAAIIRYKNRRYYVFDKTPFEPTDKALRLVLTSVGSEMSL